MFLTSAMEFVIIQYNCTVLVASLSYLALVPIVLFCIVFLCMYTGIGKAVVSVSIFFEPIERGEHTGLLLWLGRIGLQMNILGCVVHTLSQEQRMVILCHLIVCQHCSVMLEVQ